MAKQTPVRVSRRTRLARFMERPWQMDLVSSAALKEDPKGLVVSARPGAGGDAADNDIESESVCTLGTSIVQKSRGPSVRRANWTMICRRGR